MMFSICNYLQGPEEYFEYVPYFIPEGELGWEFYHSSEDTAKLYDALLEAGKPFGVSDFGTYALNTMRIEKGFRMWGQEVK